MQSRHENDEITRGREKREERREKREERRGQRQRQRQPPISLSTRGQETALGISLK